MYNDALKREGGWDCIYHGGGGAGSVFSPGLDDRFVKFAFYKCLEKTQGEELPQDYCDMEEIFHEICLSQEVCEKARAARSAGRVQTTGV